MRHLRFAALALAISATQVQADCQKGLLSSLVGIDILSCEQKKALGDVGDALSAYGQGQPMPPPAPMQPMQMPPMQPIPQPRNMAPIMIFPANGGAPTMLTPMN